MTNVSIDAVRAALGELADADYQSRVWTGRSAGEMSSFVEAVEQLYGDSGLGLALDRGEPVFSPPIDDELLELRALVGKTDGDQAPEDLIDDPRMRLVRDRAASILHAISSNPAPGRSQS